MRNALLKSSVTRNRFLTTSEGRAVQIFRQIRETETLECPPAFTVANVLCVRESEVVPNQFNPVVEWIRYVGTMVLGEFMIEDFKTCGT